MSFGGHTRGEMQDTARLIHVLEKLGHEMEQANRLALIRLRWEVMHMVEPTAKAMTRWEEQEEKGWRS